MRFRSPAPVIGLVLLSLVLLGPVDPASAQQGATPPDNARIVGSVPEIPLRWPAAAKAYRVEVFAAGKPCYSQPATTNTLVVRLVPGPVYQWRVLAYQGNKFVELVPLRTFQFSAERSLHFDGAAGSPGRGPGAAGATGQDGQTVNISLVGEPDYVRIRVAGNIQEPEVLLLRTSKPVIVTSRGGDGGSGDAGAAGASGYLQPGYDAMGRPCYQVFAATAGGPGGAGGNGGNGGTITIRAQGVDWKKCVRLVLDGGREGQGGAGGPGGTVAPLTYGGYALGNVLITGTNAPGPTGPQGAPGMRGRDGLVQEMR